jgi:hypothetical protein
MAIFLVTHVSLAVNQRMLGSQIAGLLLTDILLKLLRIGKDTICMCDRAALMDGVGLELEVLAVPKDTAARR